MNKNSLTTINNNYERALERADAIVSRGYLENLTRLEVVRPSDQELSFDAAECGCFYRLERLVTNKDENFLDKLVTVVNVAGSQNGTLVTVIESDGVSVKYYMGILSKNARADNKSDENIRKAAAGAFSGAMEGNFAGSRLERLAPDDVEALQGRLFSQKRFVSAISGLVALRDKDEKDAKAYVQGMENLINSMRGRRYAVIMIADAVSSGAAREIKLGYEMIHTELSSLLRQTLTMGESDTVTLSESRSESVSRGISEGVTKTQTRGTFSGQHRGTGKGLGAGLNIGVQSFLSANLSGNMNVNKGTTRGFSESSADGRSRQTTEQRQTGTSDSEARAAGKSRNVQLTSENRSVKGMLEKIDLHIKRIEQCESFGAFDCAAYVVADTYEDALTVAGNYGALLRGEESFLQSEHINTWTDWDKTKTKTLLQYLNVFAHPSFYLGDAGESYVEVRPSSLIGGREMAIQFGLPKKSVNGLTVIETAPFGRDTPEIKNPLRLGKFYHMGKAEEADVALEAENLRSHVFITGSTGAGKSNAIYHMLDMLQKRETPVSFLIIEPAKGEYKHIFGRSAKVYGTNEDVSPLLRVNPFAFPREIHVLEHVDRLIEIFNVCWPMYAAMPAVLKEATLRAYASCGWDLSDSLNSHGGGVFPTFVDLRDELSRVISESDYSEELKGNYSGALGTRVNSLTNGLNRLIFSSDEIGDSELFDKNVIIDLSRVGSSETKALIMGVLVMRLSEYRMARGGMNRPLRHVTVLEEAHDLLRRASFEQGAEGGNLAGKSVEMLANAIAEMRTYGEGFIIADQSPGLLDLSVIRNTNTKIILRVPELGDRELVGRAAALNDGQITELSKLETGVAAVYQNEWPEAVLCKIDKYEGEEKPYARGDDRRKSRKDTAASTSECLKLLLLGRMTERVDADVDAVKEALPRMGLSAKNRLAFARHIADYEKTGASSLWETKRFGELASIVAEIMDARRWLDDSVRAAGGDVEELDADIRRRVRDLAEDLTYPFVVETAHALMRRYAEGDETRKNTYDEWHGYVEKSLSPVIR
jgi:DNA helicase HerA-like ATPase